SACPTGSANYSFGLNRWDLHGRGSPRKSLFSHYGFRRASSSTKRLNFSISARLGRIKGAHLCKCLITAVICVPSSIKQQVSKLRDENTFVDENQCSYPGGSN